MTLNPIMALTLAQHLMHKHTNRDRLAELELTYIRVRSDSCKSSDKHENRQIWHPFDF